MADANNDAASFDGIYWWQVCSSPALSLPRWGRLHKTCRREL